MNKRQLKELELKILIEKRIRLSQKSFWEFCKTLHPDFYFEGRDYLKDYCNTLQDLYQRKLLNPNDNDNPYQRAAISFPPRHGKSRTLILFCCWCYGQDINNMILYLSYSDDSAVDFSRYVRDEISKERHPENFQIVYSDIFPLVRIKTGDSAMQKWSLEGRHFSYKAAGIGGGVTGKGATIIIIDDPIKNSMEAFNKGRKQQINNWIAGTVLSRGESRADGSEALEIINMTRWAADDPIGHALSNPDYGNTWFVYSKNAIDQNGNMLCEEVLSKKKFDYIMKTGDPAIVNANYMNKLIDEEFLMYPNLKRFNKYRPELEFETTISALDSADTGKDFLSGVIAKTCKGQVYIYDWLYTQSDSTKTPRQYAEMLYRNNVEKVRIESNNGGNIFSNYLQDILWNEYNTRKISIKTFPQTKNKEARIRDKAQWIIDNVFFPEDFHITHPQVWTALTNFLRVGKNDFDDAPDSLTILVEMVLDGLGSEKRFRGWKL
jgi:predicted phage terminase large subunit-like protein